MTRCSLMRMIVASTIVLVFAGGLSSAHGMEEVAKLTPSDAPEYGLGFGRAVAISGDFIVVGAPFDRPPDQQGIGAAYVFQRVNGSWVEQTKLTASTQFWDDTFGTSVAIDGHTIVVGAPGTGEFGGDNTRAYVYRYDGFAWNEEAELIPSGSFDYDYFGISVSISGDLIAVGAPGWISTCQVYVFRRDGTTWTEEAILVGADTDDADEFGRAVSVSDDTVVVGAPHDSDINDRAGSAYVFQFEGDAWGEVTKLVAPSPGIKDYFGDAVRVGSDTLVVGAPSFPGGGGAFLFRDFGGTWSLDSTLFSLDRAPGDQLGNSVALGDSTIMAGASGDDDGGSLSGSAYLFKRFGSRWFQVAKYVASDAASGRFFGFSAGVDGDTAVVGTAGGVAYVFDTALSIPTVSSWGVIILALLLVLAGGVVFHRRRHTSQSPCSGWSLTPLRWLS